MDLSINMIDLWILATLSVACRMSFLAVFYGYPKIPILSAADIARSGGSNASPDAEPLSSFSLGKEASDRSEGYFRALL